MKSDVVAVLLLLQAALEVLATLGMFVLMGLNPVYVVVPGAHVVLLLVLASAVARRKRWAYWTVGVLETVSVCAYWLNMLLGLLPQVDLTINLVGLLTSVALPQILAIQALLLIREPRAAAPAVVPAQAALQGVPA